MFSAIVLAAGKGTRMNSPLPKVLHPVAGVPMIVRVIQALKKAGAQEIRVVLGHGKELVQPLIEPLGVGCFVQKNQWGTADAVKAAQPETMDNDILIMNGDHPLVTSEDVQNLYGDFIERTADLGVVTARVKRPGQMGRIIRQRNQLVAIVEAKEASQDTLKINEINSGIYFTKAALLKECLPKIQSNNSKGEFYLTDIVSLSLQGQKKVEGILAPARVAFGVNSQKELSQASVVVFKRKCVELMDQGVMIIDSRSTYIEDSVTIGNASVIFPNVHIKGDTQIGSYCVIEPQAFILNSKIENSSQIRAGSYLENARVGEKCIVGPYARLRPGTQIAQEVHIGNFVELKNTKMGERSKANHLAYLGDAEIGQDTNIGCGTITCNYAVDKKKYKTEIGDRVFVGSDTQFIAPIKIGSDSVIGSGSTITKDVPANALAVARGKQFVKENYTEKVKTSSPLKKEN